MGSSPDEYSNAGPPHASWPAASPDSRSHLAGGMRTSSSSSSAVTVVGAGGGRREGGMLGATSPLTSTATAFESGERRREQEGRRDAASLACCSYRMGGRESRPMDTPWYLLNPWPNRLSPGASCQQASPKQPHATASHWNTLIQAAPTSSHHVVPNWVLMHLVVSGPGVQLRRVVAKDSLHSRSRDHSSCLVVRYPQAYPHSTTIQREWKAPL